MDTPMLKRLREVLRQTTKEEFQQDWAAIQAEGINSPDARDFVRSFRYTPVYQFKESSFTALAGLDDVQYVYDLDMSSSLALAA